MSENGLFRGLIAARHPQEYTIEATGVFELRKPRIFGRHSRTSSGIFDSTKNQPACRRWAKQLSRAH